jgi:6-phospho-3-hexuloisomerase
MSNDRMDTLIEKIQTEVMACVSQVSIESLSRAESLIEVAPRIFVSGAGRSGLCMRALAMRLMHLGKTAFVAGETTTPNIAADDLLIIGSGSGRTAGLVLMAEQARNLGAKLLLFTTHPTSPLADLADHKVIIPAPSLSMAKDGPAHTSVQPMGSLFEQSLLILCDSLIVGLMLRMGVDAAHMRQRHANLE